MSNVSMINGHIDKPKNETERDKLIELLNDKTKPWSYLLCPANIRSLADYLLANGVIVPPCKVGDVVYVLEICSCSHHYGNRCSANSTRKNVKYLDIVRLPPTHHYTRCLKLFKRPFKIEYFNQIGKKVFLTREEAEQALKGGAE